LRKIATILGVCVAVAAGGALLAVKAATEPEPGRASLARLAAGKTFAPICDANGDTRPDPAWVGASYAGDDCWAPAMPVVLNGFTASREKLMAGIAAVKSYDAKADRYERCIRDFVAARRVTVADGKKRMDVALVLIENHRLAASARNRKKAGDQIDTAITDFNQYGIDCNG